MKRQIFVCIFLIFSGLLNFSCRKDKVSTPVVKVLPIDTASVDQYVVCTIDTITFIASTKNGLPDKIFLKTNLAEVSTFFAETEVRQGLDVPLVRSLEFSLYDFQSRKQGTYIGAKIFANSKTDILVSNVDSEEKNWEIINETTNRIQVTRIDSTKAIGKFNFRMRNVSNPREFIEVKNGIFKLKYR